MYLRGSIPGYQQSGTMLSCLTVTGSYAQPNQTWFSLIGLVNTESVSVNMQLFSSVSLTFLK